MNRTDKAIDQLCRDVIRLDGDDTDPFDPGPDVPCLDVMARQAQTILDARKVRRRPPQTGKVNRRQERRAASVLVRAAVFRRAGEERGGRCEFCVEQAATDWHHILSGGRRRSGEAEETTAAICRACHRGYESGDKLVLTNAGIWAMAHGFRLASKEITHRLDKVLEARDASRRKSRG